MGTTPTSQGRQEYQSRYEGNSTFVKSPGTQAEPRPSSTQRYRTLDNTLIPSAQDVLCAETPSALASGAHVHVVPLSASWFCSGRHWAAPFLAGAVASRPGILLLEPHLAVTAGTEDIQCDSLLAYRTWWLLEEASLFGLKQVSQKNGCLVGCTFRVRNQK